ncbi:MAG TPA: SpoVR family protein, partial [Candidatus Tectomicrobia bacterium]|nr:SpoVR family protein [Candidatus Tectomicrobia bacterium]
EVAAYGLPTRARHWSYGKVYNRQRVHGQMGLSKIYEIVLNNDPGYAFLLDTNPEIANLLVVAHVYAHVDFFKHNSYFADTNRNMVNTAVEHALRIDEYIDRYGLDRVERVMDIAFAIDRHIDFHKGLVRKPYPTRAVVERTVKTSDYADLFGEEAFALKKVVVGDTMPPHPERDLLWFLAQYAPIEPWERDVLEIIRAESHYFYPQFETKILNEGWATYWHAEILNQYAELSPSETIDFGVLHSGVVNPGHRMSINPYYLGYRLLVDVERRWDKLHAAGKSSLTGREKLFEIRRQENDISFLSNYLTQELVEELELFAYGYACEHGPQERKKCRKCGEIEIKSRDVGEVIKSLTAPRYNFGAPRIVISKVLEDGTLLLEHEQGNLGTLDVKYAEKTLEYIHELWKKPIRLRTANTQGEPVVLKYTTTGFEMGEYIALLQPADEVRLSEPPTFEWTSGGNDSFSVNLSLDPHFSYRNYSTYYDGGIIIRKTSWTMPENLWNLAPKGKPIYWKIRGVRSTDRPQTVIESRDVRHFVRV